MLREIHIKDYAIIDEMTLPFSEGFHIITGETGAGKSILVDALSIIFGGKSSQDEIRHGSEEAVLEARFDPTAHSHGGLPLDDPSVDTLILKRVLSRSGKNRAYLNGALANLSALKEIGRNFAEIHGQHEHHNLIDLDWQRNLLDAFGQLVSERSRFDANYRIWRQLLRERSDLERLASERKRQEELLQYQLSEISDARLHPGEDEALEQEERILKNWEIVVSMAQKGYAILSEEEGAILSRLDEVGGFIENIDEATADAGQEKELWETSKVHLKELAALLRKRLHGVDCDPNRLQAVEERLFVIRILKKKYGSSIEAILSYRKKLEADLARISEDDTRLREIKFQFDQTGIKCQEEAEALSKKREEIKARLERRVKEELDLLGMEKTHFEIALVKKPLSENGIDQVEFMVALPGEKPKGLILIASGGELSRMMLALKVVLAEVDPVPTLVFDEIDAGIGGGISEMVGKRLLKLSKNHQVFCITHLPQIACFADHHYFVEKMYTEGRTSASVRELTKEERVQELARMLGGVTITPITLRHAEEMIETGKGALLKRPTGRYKSSQN